MVSTRADAHAAGWALSGTKSNVAQAGAADLFLVSAKSDDAIGLFAVEASARGAVRLTRTKASLTPAAMQHF